MLTKHIVIVDILVDLLVDLSLTGGGRFFRAQRTPPGYGLVHVIALVKLVISNKIIEAEQ